MRSAAPLLRYGNAALACVRRALWHELHGCLSAGLESILPGLQRLVIVPHPGKAFGHCSPEHVCTLVSMQCQCMWDAIIEIPCRVFVIDVTDRIALVEATAELITTASHPEMRNKPLWLVFNKIDLPGAIPQHELALLMRLADLQHTMGSCMQVLYRHCSADMPEPSRAEAVFLLQPTLKGIPLFIPLTRRMQVRHVSALDGTGVMDLMKVLAAFPRNARPLS